MGGRQPTNRGNTATLSHYLLMGQRQKRTRKPGPKEADGCDPKQEPSADIPEHGHPRITRDVLPAPPPATVNSTDNRLGAPLLSKSFILRGRATPPLDVPPINMPLSPELASAPKNDVPRKSISPTPRQLSLPEIDRPPSMVKNPIRNGRPCLNRTYRQELS